MSNWAMRVQAERDQLSDNIERLAAFLDRPDCAVITGCHEQIKLMFFQLDYMRSYCKVLDKRLDLAGGHVPPAAELAPAL